MRPVNLQDMKQPTGSVAGQHVQAASAGYICMVSAHVQA